MTKAELSIVGTILHCVACDQSTSHARYVSRFRDDQKQNFASREYNIAVCAACEPSVSHTRYVSRLYDDRKQHFASRQYKTAVCAARGRSEWHRHTKKSVLRPGLGPEAATKRQTAAMLPDLLLIQPTTTITSLFQSDGCSAWTSRPTRFVWECQACLV